MPKEAEPKPAQTTAEERSYRDAWAGTKKEFDELRPDLNIPRAGEGVKEPETTVTRPKEGPGSELPPEQQE